MKKPVLNSGHIDSYDYDPASKTLHVTFKNGSTYRYSDVPQEALDKYKGESSIGTFFAQHIRKKYYGRKISDG